MLSANVKITANNRGPEVNVVTWIMMVSMCCSVLTKALSNPRAVWMLSKDNLMMAAAMMCAIGQGVAVTEQVKAGLGRRQTALSSLQIERVQKAGYASQLLYIATLSVTKFTTLDLIASCTQKRTDRVFIRAMSLLIAGWGLAAFVGTASQCPVSAWQLYSGKCFNQPLFWAMITAFDILTDLFLAIFPCFILKDLQLVRKKKLTVMGAFAARGIAIPLVVVRVCYIYGAQSSTDRTFEDYKTVMATQIGMNLVIILSCLPYLKTFMEQIQSTVYTPEVRKAVGYGAGSYAMGSLGDQPDRRSGAPGKNTAGSRSPWCTEGLGETFATIVGDGPPSDRPPSDSSREQMIIKQTTTLTVVSERGGKEAS